MSRIRAALVCICASVLVGCSGGVTTPSPPSGSVTITFANLTANRAVVGTYTESGYTVSAGPGEWVTLTTYGNPAPFVQFTAANGAAVTGQLAIVAPEHATFTFKSADFYSSVTRIPYEITGVRADAAVFTVADTLPNTFGNFRTVSNPRLPDLIDTLIIRLTNALGAVSNPMGVDNIVLVR